ncbi:hypothetical protein AXY43_21870 [Clostridium sp. MF28]|uniref:MFS transporter n=1 Tax=Clostridium TaxID=1485 RepID=UPI000D229D7D|nr:MULTISPECIES: MFS transporter [Clostridium]AVK50441.1 hypothetical protein AXY43_21870 [Clostridium sp. MF28]
MILSGLFLTVISNFMFAISQELIWLYIARFIGGIGLGIVIPYNLSYIADAITKETRTKGMGYF